MNELVALLQKLGYTQVPVEELRNQKYPFKHFAVVKSQNALIGRDCAFSYRYEVLLGKGVEFSIEGVSFYFDDNQDLIAHGSSK